MKNVVEKPNFQLVNNETESLDKGFIKELNSLGLDPKPVESKEDKLDKVKEEGFLGTKTGKKIQTFVRTAIENKPVIQEALPKTGVYFEKVKIDPKIRGQVKSEERGIFYNNEKNLVIKIKGKFRTKYYKFFLDLIKRYGITVAYADMATNCKELFEIEVENGITAEEEETLTKEYGVSLDDCEIYPGARIKFYGEELDKKATLRLDTHLTETEFRNIPHIKEVLEKIDEESGTHKAIRKTRDLVIRTVSNIKKPKRT